MVERAQHVERLGFDWVSVSEHHYSPRRLTPAPIVAASHLAAHSTGIKIAVLGPIVSQGNPVRIAEELATARQSDAGPLGMSGCCAGRPGNI